MFELSSAQKGNKNEDLASTYDQSLQTFQDYHTNGVLWNKIKF